MAGDAVDEESDLAGAAGADIADRDVAAGQGTDGLETERVVPALDIASADARALVRLLVHSNEYDNLAIAVKLRRFGVVD